jgi:hypothetical protein
VTVFEGTEHTCETCTYPYWGEGCTNPCCPANPSLSEEFKAGLIERHEQHRGEEAERVERMRLYRSSFGWSA